MPYKPKEHVDPEDYVPKGNWSKYKRQILEKLEPLFPGPLEDCSFVSRGMVSYLSVQVAPGEYRHFSVPKAVYTYVRQLETYIKHPGESRLLKVYPHLTPSEQLDGGGQMKDEKYIKMLEEENKRLRKVQAIMLNAIMRTTSEFHDSIATLVSSFEGERDG